MKTTKPKDTATSRWLSFRPEIKVLDCTIRDGGLMNNHHFDDKIVKVVYDTCVAAGVDYMELGYKASRKDIKAGEHGCWKYCVEDDLRRIVGDNQTDLKLTVMADAERCDYHEDILPKKDSVLDMIRVATYIHQIPTALDMVKDAHDKGYETTVNLMAVSTVPESELDEGLEMLAKSEAKAIYVVDSFGALYSERIHDLVKKYLRLLQGVAARKWACTCTTTCSSPSPTPSKASSKARIFSTPPWPAWAAARAIARWNCSSPSCTTRNTNCAPCSTACKTTSSRCARNCCGATTCRICSPAC